MLDMIAQPAFWASIALLIGLELALSADNFRYVSAMTAQLPEDHRQRVHRISIVAGALFRLVILFGVAWMLGLERAAFTVAGWSPSWREVILIAGGLFLIYRAVTDLYALVEPSASLSELPSSVPEGLAMGVAQIVLVNAVLSVDMVITAIGLSPYVAAMAVAAIAAIALIFFAGERIGAFMGANPAAKALALGLLLTVGIVLVADGLGMEIARPYLYAAFGFAVLVLAVSKLARVAADRRAPGDPDVQVPRVAEPEPVAVAAGVAPKFAEVRTEPLFEPEPERDGPPAESVETVVVAGVPSIAPSERIEPVDEPTALLEPQFSETPDDAYETPADSSFPDQEPVDVADDIEPMDPDERPLGVSERPVPKSRPKRKPVLRKPERPRTGRKKRE